MADRADDWGKHLDAAVFATNTSIQSTTKITCTPFRMMFSGDPRFPVEVEKQLESTTSEDVRQVLQTTDVEATLDKILKKQADSRRQIRGSNWPSRNRRSSTNSGMGL